MRQKCQEKVAEIMDCEQESEYDTDSDIEDQVDNEDEMTFLRAVTTRSGRMVKVTSKFF